MSRRVRAAECMSSAKSTARARPSFLARYIAASASRSRADGSAFDDEVTATPMLTETTSSAPCTAIGRASSACSASATARATSEEGVESSRTTNSSPPKRATVSPGCTAALRRRASSTRTSSPAS